MEFTSSPEETASRIVALDRYLSAEVLSAAGFCCRSLDACRDSHRGDFFEGQLHHVGRHYDLKLNGRPFRVAVVGQEYGHRPAPCSRPDRTRMIVERSGAEKRFVADDEHDARNPHMRGTTSVLRLLMGNGLGTDYEGEHVRLNRKAVHVFEAFALTNYLLCSALAGGQKGSGAKPGRSTKTMRSNCARHFAAMVEILEPTVMIVQGLGVRRWLEHVVTDTEAVGENLERALIGETSVLLANFSHPSAHGQHNWGVNDRTPYLLNVVKPAVRAIHREVLSGPSG